MSTERRTSTPRPRRRASARQDSGKRRVREASFDQGPGAGARVRPAGARHPRSDRRPDTQGQADRGQRHLRIAAIDIGSNSIHMVVVEPDPQGGYRILDREREMVRLGKSALGGGRLSPRAMRDGLEALLKMTTLARLKGAKRIEAVATSAVREAANGADFLARIKAQTGLSPRLLDGQEEGKLIYRAVREAVDLGSGVTVIVDVGGGSSEWIETRDGQLERVVSLPLGSLRCAAWLEGNPPGRGDLTRFRRRIRRQIAGLPGPPKECRMIATSGTAACCAALADLAAGREWKVTAGGLRELRRRELDGVIAHLGERTRRQIAQLPPVGAPRSESILAGAILLDELMRHAGARSLALCDRALREGVVLAALGRKGAPTAASAPGEVRRRQILQLAQRTDAVFGHNQQTARLAMRLFDLTASLHGLGEREREWLEYAALLHDIGYAIHYRKHHLHTYYLITAANLDAFDPREVEIIAHVARYHRGARPQAKHTSFATLKSWQQRTIERLAALLRVADALDRTHASRVTEVYCAIRKRRVRLEVLSPYDVALEIETARSRVGLFERALGRRLSLRQGLEVAPRRKSASRAVSARGA